MHFLTFYSTLTFVYTIFLYLHEMCMKYNFYVEFKYKFFKKTKLKWSKWNYG